MDLLTIVVSVVLLLPSATFAFLPNGACSVRDQTCEIDGDNLVSIAAEIPSADACREICSQLGNCDYWSYFGASSFPFVSTCILLNNCSVLDVCTDCVTEEQDCFYCTAPVEGSLSTNLLATLGDIENEVYCSLECQAEVQCQYYTYHWPNSTLFPSTCFLLSSLEEPIIPCANGTCTSGSPTCFNSLCEFLDTSGSILSKGVKVTSTRDFNMVRIGPCPTAIAVAVGGGGTTEGDAGSGSGYVTYEELRAFRPYLSFEAIVASADEASEVNDLTDGITILRSGPGADGPDDGGSGYSGGGASDGDPAGGDGGSDGNDGGDSDPNTGGQGSGLDITTIPIKSFALSPALGGKGQDANTTCKDGNGLCGGGGGGVLVDDTGPSGGNETHGEGYGGGGGGLDEAGYDGVILLDFI